MRFALYSDFHLEIKVRNALSLVLSDLANFRRIDLGYGETASKNNIASQRPAVAYSKAVKFVTDKPVLKKLLVGCRWRDSSLNG